jgi:tight adherence protein B
VKGLAALLLATAVWAAHQVRASARRSARIARLVASDETAPRAVTFDVAEIAIGVVGLAIGWIVAAASGAVVCGVVAVLAWRRRMTRHERVPAAVAQERFADAVDSLSASVRAGSSLPQAIAYAAGEAEAPVHDGLDRLAADLEVGVPFDEALDRWRVDESSADVDLVVGALELHRRSGGDLPAVLDQVAGTIRDRVGVTREVRSLTAQARLSAWILGLLPVAFFVFLWVTARSDIEGALATPAGLACITIGLVLEGGAVLWIRSLLQVA